MHQLQVSGDTNWCIFSLHTLLLVKGLKVKLHLPFMLGLEGSDFKLYCYKRAQSSMKEQEVNKVLLPSNFKAVLVANKGKGTAHFGEKTAKVLHQCLFQFPLGVFISQLQKVESVPILDRKHSLSLQFRRECFIKIGLVEQVFFVAFVVNLVLKYRLCPAKPGRRPKIKFSFKLIFASGENNKIFSPTDFCNQRLQF